MADGDLDPDALPPRSCLLGLDSAALETLCVDLGEPSYRGRQLAHQLYVRRERCFGAMATLPAALRDRLEERFDVGRGEIVAVAELADGTRKVLLGIGGGDRVETVLIPSADRLSLCVSSQTGCAIGCTFCATGGLGAGRNLSVGEITDQLLTATDLAERRVSHVVFMGMGQPLLNLAAVIDAIRLWRDEIELSPRHVTVSTVGLPEGIARLSTAELPVTLAISLHAADDEVRSRLIATVGERLPVDEVLRAARGYQAATGRRVSYEIVLLDGVNDRAVDADALAKRLRRGEHVNLIPYNPIDDAPYGRPAPERVTQFRERLDSAGLNVTVRRSRGEDIAGACGQLRARSDEG